MRALLLLLLALPAFADDDDLDPYRIKHRDQHMMPNHRRDAEKLADLQLKHTQKRRADLQSKCDRGLPYACYRLGKESNDLKLLLRACDAGEAPACTDAGSRLNDEGKTVRAHQLWRRGCNLGDPDGCDAFR